MFLLDTDTMIYNLKGDEAVRKNISRHIADPMKISAVTLMELYYGAYKSQQVEKNLAKIKVLENTLEVLRVGMESVEVFGIYKAKLEKAGTPLDDFDLILASCALANNLTLVTNNIKHFKRIKGLRLMNWSINPEASAG